MYDAKITLPPPLLSGAASVAITTCCYLQEAEVSVRCEGCQGGGLLGIVVVMWLLRVEQHPGARLIVALGLESRVWGSLFFLQPKLGSASESRIDVGEQWLRVVLELDGPSPNRTSAICRRT